MRASSAAWPGPPRLSAVPLIRPRLRADVPAATASAVSRWRGGRGGWAGRRLRRVSPGAGRRRMSCMWRWDGGAMAVVACGGGRSPCSVPSRAASHGGREVVAGGWRPRGPPPRQGGHRRVARIHVLHSICFSVDVSDVDISVYVDVDTDNHHRTSTARTSGSVSHADRRRRPRARLPCGRPVLSAARTSITRTSRATGRTDVDCADFDQGRSSQRHLTQQQAWDGQRHLTQ